MLMLPQHFDNIRCLLHLCNPALPRPSDHAACPLPMLHPRSPHLPPPPPRPTTAPATLRPVKGSLYVLFRLPGVPGPPPAQGGLCVFPGRPCQRVFSAVNPRPLSALRPQQDMKLLHIFAVTASCSSPHWTGGAHTQPPAHTHTPMYTLRAPYTHSPMHTGSPTHILTPPAHTHTPCTHSNPLHTLTAHRSCSSSFCE